MGGGRGEVAGVEVRGKELSGGGEGVCGKGGGGQRMGGVEGEGWGGVGVGRGKGHCSTGQAEVMDVGVDRIDRRLFATPLDAWCLGFLSLSDLCIVHELELELELGKSVTPPESKPKNSTELNYSQRL